MFRAVLANGRRRYVVAGVPIAAIVGVIALSVLGGSSGSATHGAATKHASKHSDSITAAGMKFMLPDDWKQMSKSELPATTEVDGPVKVVAGACVDRSKAGACGIDVTYMLAGEHSKMPGLADLQVHFASQLPRELPGSEVVRSEFDRTEQGVRMLVHEVSYRRQGATWHKLFTAYRADGTGLIVVAVGPAEEFLQHRSTMLDKLREARHVTDSASAHGGGGH